MPRNSLYSTKFPLNFGRTPENRRKIENKWIEGKPKSFPLGRGREAGFTERAHTPFLLFLSLLVLFLFLLIFSMFGCGEERASRNPIYPLPQETYYRWLYILGSDVAVIDYAFEAKSCLRECLQDESCTDYFIFDPPQEPGGLICDCICQK